MSRRGSTQYTYLWCSELERQCPAHHCSDSIGASVAEDRDVVAAGISHLQSPVDCMVGILPVAAPAAVDEQILLVAGRAEVEEDTADLAASEEVVDSTVAPPHQSHLAEAHLRAVADM